MRKTMSIPIDDVIPSIGAVLKGQGVPERVNPEERMTRLVRSAVSIYRDMSNPVGLLMEISKGGFETVYDGEGRNEDETPLGNIYKSSDNLALFAVTIGENVCTKITRLFDTNDFALGSMLDSAASEGTEMAAQAVESYYRGYLMDMGHFGTSAGIMQFSPGYCGWHVSAQKKLFEFLRPTEIGIELGESFLMRPLKSISGVIVVGPKEIFEFEDVFPFCNECETHSCRDRIRAVLEQ